MAQQEITDLDALLGKPKRVKLNDKIYLLPAQIPVPLYLLTRQRNGERAQQIEDGEDVEFDLVEEIAAQLLELFQVHQPKMTEIPSVGIGQLLEIIPTVYPPRGLVEGDDEEEVPPTRTPARTGRSNTTRQPTKRRKSR